MRPAISSKARDSSPISSRREEPTLRRQIAASKPVDDPAQPPQRRGQVNGQHRAHAGDDQHDRPVVRQDIGRIEPGRNKRDESIAALPAPGRHEDQPAVRQPRRSHAAMPTLQERRAIGAGNKVSALGVGQKMLTREIRIQLRNPP